MNRSRVRTLAAVAVALMAWGRPSALLAQTGGSPLTEHDCRVWANQLGSNPRSEAFRDALSFGPPAGCGAEWSFALADALGRPEVVGDPEAVDALLFHPSHYRHPAILDAAARLAGDRAAPLVGRILALKVLLRQHNVQRTVKGLPSELVSRTLPMFCHIDFLVHSEYHFEAPLPVDYQERIMAVAGAITSDEAEPTILRYVASCVQQDIDGVMRWWDDGVKDPPG